MIRRGQPLGDDAPRRWVLIPQSEHARLSHELAATWGGATVEPLFCEAHADKDPLAPARREFLAAALRHDDGWREWWANPAIDPEHGRPYAFTEMPPADAQRLWSASIEACREEGPLAGWVVASHFSALQSKRDHDWPEWRPWIERVDRERAAWLEEWVDLAVPHTVELANRTLAWLQAFDWMSLWLCCRCPAEGDAEVAAPPVLELDGATPGWSPTRWSALGRSGRVVVAPWPFTTPSLELAVSARAVAAEHRYANADELFAEAEPRELRWRLRRA